MKSWKTNSGNKIFKVLSGRSNAYLIITEKYNILVDTGISSAYRDLDKNIKRVQPSNTKIDYLVLTHTHFDHCQNAARIKNDYGCRIIVSEHEKEFTEAGFTPVPGGTIPITKFIVRIGAKLDLKRFRYKTFTPDILVDEYFELHDGRTDIKIIRTKGHSSGSLSVLVDNEIALAGDTLFGIFKNSVFPPFADNQAEMIKSWNKLLNTGCEIFLPGHGKEIKRDLLKREYYKYTPSNNIEANRSE